MADIVWAELRVQTDKAKKDVQSYNAEIIKTGTLTKQVGNTGTQAFNQQAAATNKAAASQKNIQKEVANTTKSFSGMKAGIASLAATMGLALGVQQIVAFSKASIKAASDLNETVSKTGELFGDSTDAVLRWSKTTATAIGQSQQQALDGASTFAIMGRAAGLTGDKLVTFSTDFTELASDLASFNNTSPEEAINAIGAALRGEAEPIRRYGVLLTDATIKQEAMALGIIKTTKEALTPQQRVLAVQAAIYKQTSAAQGDFARTSEGLANQQKILAAQWHDLQASLGTGLLPVLTDVIKGVNALVGGDFSTSGMDKMGEAFDRWFVFLEKIPTPLGGFIKGFRSLMGAVREFQNGNILSGIGKGFEALGNVITFGLYDTVKGFFVPAKDEVIKGVTDMDKKLLELAAATDQEVNEKLKELGGTTTETGRVFKKFADDLRQDLIEGTFKELIKVFNITEAHYEKMVRLSDRYGISALISADAIQKLKQASREDLTKTFNNLNAELSITGRDFNEYMRLITELEPIQDDLGKSTEKLIGPYDMLTAAVSKSMKVLQDQVTLFSQGKGTWEDALKLAHRYADAQNTLVGVNDLVTDSLKRQTHEGLLPLADANNFVMLTEQRLVERFKFTDDQIKQRDEIFKELGVNQVDIYTKTLEQITALQEAEIRASDGTLKAITEITEKYSKAIAILQIQQAGDIAGAFAGLAKNLGALLSNLFGEAAAKNVAFLAFTKSIAIAEITLSSFQAIAAGIAKLASTNPVDIIGGIAAIIGGVSNFIGGIISQVESIDTPSIPAFEKGTGFVTRGNNPQGIDTVPAMLTEGEGVVTRGANSQYPGLVDALNMGKGDDYVMKHFVEPILRAEEKSTAEKMAASLGFMGGDFDDKRLSKIGVKQVGLLAENNSLLRKIVNQKDNPLNIN